MNKANLLLSKHAFNFKDDILERAREQFMNAQELEKIVLEEAKAIMEEQHMFKRLGMNG